MLISYSRPGDIYLTRNTREINKSFGYWQHCAVSCGWAVVEGQEEPGAVIMVEEEPFRRRNPERLLLRLKDDSRAYQVASLAQYRLRDEYDRRLWNCVDVVRTVFQEALERELRLWQTPTAIGRSNLLREIEHFKDYEHWKQPADWYEGRVV